MILLTEDKCLDSYTHVLWMRFCAFSRAKYLLVVVVI